MKKARLLSPRTSLILVILAITLVAGAVMSFSDNHLNQLAAAVQPTAKSPGSVPSSTTTEPALTAYTSEVGGYQLSYPKNWIATGFNQAGEDQFGPQSTLVRLFSKQPSVNAALGDYVCVEVSLDYSSIDLKNGQVSERLPNGLSLYRVVDHLAGRSIAVAYLSLGNRATFKLPSGKTLFARATYNCLSGDAAHTNLIYDQQLTNPAFIQAIAILKSISF